MNVFQALITSKHVFKLLLLFVTVIGLMFITVSSNQKEEDPLFIRRPDAVYESVLTKSHIERRVTSWYHGYYRANLPEDIQVRYTGKTWAEEQHNYLTETGAAGMDGPFATWSLGVLGESGLNDLHREYRMMFPYLAHHSGLARRALDMGAVFVLPGGHVACWDTIYSNIASEATAEWLKIYGNSPWLSDVIGRDEPLNGAASLRSPAVVDSVNDTLKARYGVHLELSAGDPDVSWDEWTTNATFSDASPHEAALLRIAL